MYDELEEEERADIRLAVSVLGMLKLCDESASMLDAFVCSKNLVERLKEEQKNAKDEKERLSLV